MRCCFIINPNSRSQRGRAIWEEVQKELENGLTTVGTEVNIKHLKGTLVGKTVKIISVLKEIDRKKLVFDVEVLEDGIVVGTGTHTRFIIEPIKFYEKLKNAK